VIIDVTFALSMSARFAVVSYALPAPGIPPPLERHPRHQIARANVRGEAPVLVRVELAVSIEILEAQSVLLDDRRAARAETRLCRLGEGEARDEGEATQDFHWMTHVEAVARDESRRK
jgi:hypothetical protein